MFGQANYVGPPKFGRREFGVPPGGAMDDSARRILLSALGLPESGSVWEVFGQVSFEATGPGSVAWLGRGYAAEIDGQATRPPGRWNVRERIVLLPRPNAGYAYLFATDRRLSEARLDDNDPAEGPMLVVPGPYASHLPSLEKWRFTVSPKSNRVGIRLAPSLPPHDLVIASEPMCLGAIQCAHDGTPLIVGPDGPTIGGYPVPAVIASHEFRRLSSLGLGAEISFQRISIRESSRQAAEKAFALSRLCDALRLSAIR